MSKTYTKRTNAKRGALAAGIPESEVELTVHKVSGEAPRFGFRHKQTQAVAPAKAAGKVQRAPAARVLAKPREQRNGVKRPTAGGLCAAVWEWLDAHPDTNLADVRDEASKRGWNVNNAAIELYQWRKFSGIKSVNSPKVVKEAQAQAA